jgi:hypothetical protein
MWPNLDRSWLKVALPQRSHVRARGQQEQAVVGLVDLSEWVHHADFVELFEEDRFELAELGVVPAELHGQGFPRDGGGAA